MQAPTPTLSSTYRLSLLNTVETAIFAEHLAAELVNFRLLTLYGDLGSGKTFTCQAIIRSLLKSTATVTSPTFNILHTYQDTQYTIYHYDLYRIKHFSELEELNLEEAMLQGICLIEWPEVMQEHLPCKRLEVRLRSTGIDTREVLLTCHGGYFLTTEFSTLKLI